MDILDNFNNRLNDITILQEYSFFELYPWYYLDATEDLKKNIITNLTVLPEQQFNAFLKYIKEQIQEYHVFDPKECMIQKWLKNFDLVQEDFPFLFNEDIKSLLLPKYKDDSLQEEQKRLVYSIQREFHLYAVFLEVQKTHTFIDELLMKEVTNSHDFVSDPTISSDKSDYKNEAWFKIGLLFANGEMDTLLRTFKSNGTQIANHLGNKNGLRPYITESIGVKKKISNKSVFSDRGKMDKIILHCNENNIPVVSAFLELLPTD